MGELAETPSARLLHAIVVHSILLLSTASLALGLRAAISALRRRPPLNEIEQLQSGGGHAPRMAQLWLYYFWPLLSLALMGTCAFLLAHDAHRRHLRTRRMDARQRELEELVASRTPRLSMLSPGRSLPLTELISAGTRETVVERVAVVEREQREMVGQREGPDGQGGQMQQVPLLQLPVLQTRITDGYGEGPSWAQGWRGALTQEQEQEHEKGKGKGKGKKAAQQGKVLAR